MDNKEYNDLKENNIKSDNLTNDGTVGEAPSSQGINSEALSNAAGAYEGYNGSQSGNSGQEYAEIFGDNNSFNAAGNAATQANSSGFNKPIDDLNERIQEQHDYYFSNNSAKSDARIREEERQERERQKMLLRQKKSGFAKSGARKFAAMAAMSLCFGIIGGLGFAATAYIGTEMIDKNRISSAVAESAALTTDTSENVKTVTTVSGYRTLNDVSEIVSQNKPAMVNISATTMTILQDFFRGSYYQEAPSSGSGFIISEDDENYYIATNNHVVENSTALSVSFIDNTVAEAVVKGRDAYNDLAVISVKKSDVATETQKLIKTVEIGDSENLVEGQAVVAMGNALGYGQSTTTGIISALDRTITTEDGSIMENLIQIDAAINFGNSGGALLDASGRVIGINSAKNGSVSVEGMGYAIPISKAQPILKNILDNDRSVVDERKRGMLGVTGVNTTAEVAASYGIPVGFYIQEVTAGTGAAKAGISKGDVIVEVSGFKVQTQADIAERLSYFEAGEAVDVTIMRQIDGEYKELQLKVELSKRSESYIQQENNRKNTTQPDASQDSTENGGGSTQRPDTDSNGNQEEQDSKDRLDSLIEEFFGRP